MLVVKRNGDREPADLKKIIDRVESHAKTLNVDAQMVAREVIQSIYNEISTQEIDEIIAAVAGTKIIVDYDYDVLAGRIHVSALHKYTPKTFSDCMLAFKEAEENGATDLPRLHPDLFEVISRIGKELDKKIVDSRDYRFGHLGFKTLETAYLMKINGVVSDRPQYMYMRAAIQLQYDLSKEDCNLKGIIKIYNDLSTHLSSHATPTIMNAMLLKNQLSSCFLEATEDDSIPGIYNTLRDVAEISQSAGGIGIHIHNVRAKGAPIRGSGGVSNGIKPMLQVFNASVRYVDQGGGKRKGAMAVYLEPWHADIEDFIKLGDKNAKAELVAKDLFYALWVPDLFMERVKNEQDWTLMCPAKCPGLSEVYDSDDDRAFTKLYEQYEREGRGTKTVPAKKLYEEILNAQIKDGHPYMLFKDACNKKSNQKNLGTIKSSNLCTEIIQYSDSQETAVCNLMSLVLVNFLSEKDGELKFDFDKLAGATRRAITSLNNVIDKGYYPIEKARVSNMKHRPVGIGVQSLADVFFKLNLPYTSRDARKLNKDIFECIYYNALKESCELAKKRKATYESFPGSPASQGILQFDMWGVKPSDNYDWDKLKKDIQEFGLLNSLLLAPMPTGSTAQILGNFESFEAQHSNIYRRDLSRGEFIVINKHLQKELKKRGIYNSEMVTDIINNGGSVQGIKNIPEDIQEIYKTIYEIRMKDYIQMAADRGAFIDQSQSMSLYIPNGDTKRLALAHFYGWELGLKTGMYYLRSKSARRPTSNTEGEVKERVEEKTTEQQVCSIFNPEDCIACGS